MAYTTITGQLGKDPEQHTSQDGNTTYTRCSIGWIERTKDKTGQWVDGPTIWVQVTLFGRQATNVAASLHKGDRVTATGQLRPETWHSQHGEETVFTMTADTLTPNLTFATTQVTRNPKGGNAASDSNSWGASNGGNSGAWNNTNPTTSWGTTNEQSPF